MNNNLKTLFNTVIENDYCVGCGICASLEGSPLKMSFDDKGKFKPIIVKEELNNNNDYLKVCPFSNESQNEDELGESLYKPIKEIHHDDYIGYYLKNYAGYVKEHSFRERGSSGGMANWIAYQLLEKGLVDGIIHVRSADDSADLLFEYSISYDEHQLFSGSKSKYYPIELSQVLDLVKKNDKKYALIGIPCFIKSVRLLSREDKIIKERIVFYIGLVCGHLKSSYFAESIGWQMGIEPNNLMKIDFRKKLEDKKANNYGVEVVGSKGGKVEKLVSPTKDLYTTNWGQGMFKYNACEFCDDVLAETADVTVGDAWLPKYAKDSKGTNIISIRNPEILKIFNENEEKVHLEELSAEDIYLSQAGGFRHRREGLSYRLHLKDSVGEWRPEKRVNASNNISSKRKEIYKQRYNISKKSFEAYNDAELENDFNLFKERMNPLVKKYTKIATPSIYERVLTRVKTKLPVKKNIIIKQR